MPETRQKADIATVYQELALSPALLIADNMFLGRELRRSGLAGTLLRKLDRPAMEQFVRDKLSELGLLTIQNIVSDRRLKPCPAASVRVLLLPGQPHSIPGSSS